MRAPDTIAALRLPLAHVLALVLALVALPSQTQAADGPASTTPTSSATPPVPATSTSTSPKPALAGAAPMEARLVYRTVDGVYVDVGSEAGLAEGASGQIARGAAPLARFTVAKAAHGSAFLRFQGAPTGALPAAGEPLALLLDRPAAALAPGAVTGTAAAAGISAAGATGTGPMGTRNPSQTLREGDKPELRPLLAPPDLGDNATTDAENIFHGKITAREAVQVGTADQDLDYSLTRVRTAGSVERIAGTPWALEWNGEVSYRGGQGLHDTRNYDDLRLEVFQLSVFRRFEDRGFIRLGRFLPRELPSIGFMDGVHGETSLADDHLRLGAVVGLKPTRDRLDPTGHEPTAAGYATVAFGDLEQVRYLGTVGVLGSLYEGKADRFALLLDQRVDAGALGAWSSMEVDFHDQVREGVRLTRWNFLGTWDALEALRLGAGVDRFELPDTEGERSVSEPGFLEEDELFLDTGYWRYYGRATVRMPEALTLDGEASFTDEDGELDDAWRYSLSLTRTGLGDSPAASLTVAAYNLRSDRTEGWGGRISAFLPLGAEDRVSLQPAVSARWTQHSTGGARFFDAVDDADDIFVIDVSCRVQWVISHAWTLFGGASWARTADDGRLLVDVGATWRW